jgi:hypothetical protein
MGSLGEIDASTPLTPLTVSEVPAPVSTISADAKTLTFVLNQNPNQEHTGEWKWKVYTEGGAPAAESASFEAGALTLTLTSSKPIAPRKYYVSLTAPGKAESKGRLVLWDEPLTGTNAMSLAERFNIPDEALPSNNGGTAENDVSAVFNALHAYIASVGASGAGSTVPYVQLGDWVDLPSLSVAKYTRSDGNNIANAINDGQGGPVLNKNLGGDKGYLLRLIVVGNNSFHSGKGVGGAYNLDTAAAQNTYGDYMEYPPGSGTSQYIDHIFALAGARAYNDATPHLVFQFQNIPGLAKMQTYNSHNGYLKSGMRAYLVPVIKDFADPSSGLDPDSGNFLEGLVNAGVPDAVLFAPKRYVTNDGQRWDYYDYYDHYTEFATGTDEIADKVWLPTAREMFGSDAGANVTYENNKNQARLEYYSGDTEDEAKAKRVKYNSSGNGQWYWEASPGSTGPVTTEGTFCSIGSSGSANYTGSTADYGVAPAFCVW